MIKWEFTRTPGNPLTLCNECHGFFNDCSEGGVQRLGHRAVGNAIFWTGVLGFDSEGRSVDTSFI